MALRFIADLYEPTGSARERCRTAAGEQRKGVTDLEFVKSGELQLRRGLNGLARGV